MPEKKLIMNFNLVYIIGIYNVSIFTILFAMEQQKDRIERKFVVEEFSGYADSNGDKREYVSLYEFARISFI